MYQAVGKRFSRPEHADHSANSVSATAKLNVFSVVNIGAPPLGAPASLCEDLFDLPTGPSTANWEAHSGSAHGLGFLATWSTENAVRNCNSIMEVFERYTL
jgi:hypothetical protein